ncbi:SDR family NAD(P)-dependent oxidoreductase, partial [Streptomyces sp. NPDC059538]|uniref:SDR family NAD(P)-dependent oxidoreductase n=1 Tax=Streptomyces sp. NPDC059538 TaxID=3346860 RepID=UPI0036ADA3B3
MGPKRFVSICWTLGGPQDNLLVTKLDVTRLDEAEAAAQAAVDRFGRIDVLVNNAGNSHAGAPVRWGRSAVQPTT